MNAVQRAVIYSFIDSYLGIVLSLISFTVLARLLAPEQIGIYSVALAIIAATQVLRDFGLVSFLIQKKDLTREHIGTAWGISLILGGTLFILMHAAAPFIGNFYSDDRIISTIRIITLNFLLLPFNSVCLALLRREMNFSRLMRINQSAAVASTLLTILLAWSGKGAISLAIGSVTLNFVTMLGLFFAGMQTRLAKPNLLHWKEILHFGGPLTCANVITSVAMDINDLVIGKVLGFKQVALVSRAQGLMNLFHRDFMTAVRNVAYPAYALANRNNESLETKYLASLSAVTIVAWPFYGFTALFPLEVLRLLFGPQWDQSAPLVPLFCAAGSFSVLMSLVPSVMLAAGHAKLVATSELIFQPMRAAILATVVILYRDLYLFACAFMLVAVLQVVIVYVIKQRCMPTDFAKLARITLINISLAAAALLPAFIVKLSVFRPNEAVSNMIFIGCALLTLLTWLCMLTITKHLLYREVRPLLEKRFKRTPMPAV